MVSKDALNYGLQTKVTIYNLTGLKQIEAEDFAELIDPLEAIDSRFIKAKNMAEPADMVAGRQGRAGQPVDLTKLEKILFLSFLAYWTIF